ncbi:hypothetical protein GGI35DRAFT_463539, partial [Trichoderma velutinum]
MSSPGNILVAYFRTAFLSSSTSPSVQTTYWMRDGLRFILITLGLMGGSMGGDIVVISRGRQSSRQSYYYLSVWALKNSSACYFYFSGGSIFKYLTHFGRAIYTFICARGEDSKLATKGGANGQGKHCRPFHFMV